MRRRYLRIFDHDPEQDVGDEIRHHLEARTQDLIASGMDPDVARAEARRRFGRVEAVHRECVAIDHARRRQEQRSELWGSVAQDLSFAIRAVRARPTFAAVVMFTLALGVGTITAAFSVVDAVLLRPLPLPHAERLVLVWSRSDAMPESWLSYPEYTDLRDRDRAFDHVAALRDVRFTVSGDGEPEEVSALGVSANLFSTLGVRAALGRTFLAREDQAGAEHVALLSDGYWQRRFGGDPDAVGRTILLNGEPYVITGILPREFRLLPPSSVFPSQVDVWVPLASTLTTPLMRSRDVRYLHVIGRLRPGATPEHVQADLDAAARTFRQEHPDAYQEAEWGLRLVAFQEQIVRGIRPALLVLLAAVCLLLLVVCSNVTSLVLARNATRTREIATRLAIGANRARIAQQLVAEAAVLAATGGALGLLLAYAGIELLRAVGPATLPRLDEVGIDLRAFTFAVMVTLFTCLLFGLLPALQSANRPPSSVLRESGRGSTSSRLQGRVRRAFVVGELATALALLVATGLVGKSFVRLRQVPLGFDPANVFSARLSLSPLRFGSGEQRVRFMDEVLRALGETPGVAAAGAVTQLPLSGAYLGSSFDVEGATSRAEGPFSADLRGVSPDYFRAMSILIMRGRGISQSDNADALPVAVVDETLANRFWPGDDPVGKRLRWSRSGEWLEIVGVVRAVKHSGVAEAPRETVYRPYAQYATMPTLYLTIRSSSAPATIARLVRREVRRLAPDHAVADARMMEERVGESTAQMRLNAILLAIFAGVALVLASVGVFGIVAYDVSQRTREIGIRMAVGAQVTHVLWLVGRQSLRLIGFGVGIGWGIALVCSRGLESLLFGVEAVDPLVFMVVSLILIGVAAVATLLPARRATRIDPSIALHAD